MVKNPKYEAKHRTVVLCILDGWGHDETSNSNAIKIATTPTWDRWVAEATAPNALVETSGHHVGLPKGQMGNSEVGHMNIGAGRVITQDLPKINDSLSNGSFYKLPFLNQHIEEMRKTKGTCHILGLISPGGVHSHENHVLALARFLSKAKIPVAIHAFLDGRDTPPKSAKQYISQLEHSIKDMTNVNISTVCGRYFSMDRDNNWDRIKIAFDAIVDGKGTTNSSSIHTILQAYDANVTDEFIKPHVIANYKGMNDGDGIIMANFRADRCRQILDSILDKNFSGFNRRYIPNLSSALGLTEYSDSLNKLMQTLFPSEPPEKTLGEVIANANIRQLRIAETEKYAHVTFFFNGGREKEFVREKRTLIPSPDVPTYDLKAEMSAYELTEKLVMSIESGEFGLIVVNYANGDMVGHTGVLDAAIKAVSTIDNCLAKVEEAVLESGSAMLVTADHGNCELMINPITKEPHTAHTTGCVPIVLVGVPNNTGLENGTLADIAPTILTLMRLKQPSEMTGKSLIRL